MMTSNIDELSIFQQAAAQQPIFSAWLYIQDQMNLASRQKILVANASKTHMQRRLQPVLR
jgi:hypothetical protein